MADDYSIDGVGDAIDTVIDPPWSDDVHTGTPPPIAPSGSSILGLGVRARGLLGAGGTAVFGTEPGRDFVGGVVQPTEDQDSPAGGAGAWIAEHARELAIGVALLAVTFVVGQLFTINVGDSTS